MPVKKVRGGYKVVSYVSGKTLKKLYKSKKAAQTGLQDYVIELSTKACKL